MEKLKTATGNAAQYTKLIAIVPENGAVRVVLGKE